MLLIFFYSSLGERISVRGESLYIESARARGGRVVVYSSSPIAALWFKG